MSLPSATVLLVEDDDGDALLVEEMLADVAPHVDVQRERSMAGATGRSIDGEVACVLLDLGLPDARGLEALQQLRAATRGVPIIVLTGLADESVGIEALGAGAQEYLVKGQVDGPLLLRAVRYAVERVQAESAERALLEARLHERENARLERGLLPTALIHDPAIAFSSTYRPGRRRALLGGDFFDAVQLSDGSVVATIGDVSGQGPDEAALGACLRIAWRALMLAERPLPEALTVLDSVLVNERLDPDLFATAQFARLHPDRRAIDLYTAGHPPPLLLGAGAPVALEPRPVHLPLGIPWDAPWTAYTVPVESRGALLMYTDGLIEGLARPDGTRLGVDGLVDLVTSAGWAQAPYPDGPKLVTALVEEVEALNGGELTDDLAVALLSWP